MVRDFWFFFFLEKFGENRNIAKATTTKPMTTKQKIFTRTRHCALHCFPSEAARKTNFLPPENIGRMAILPVLFFHSRLFSDEIS